MTAYHRLDATTHLFSLDITVAVGGITASPRDVVRFDAANVVYQLELDGAAAGVPDGARIDALTVGANGTLLLSFDTSVSIGINSVVDDEDLVAFDGVSFGHFFDTEKN